MDAYAAGQLSRSLDRLHSVSYFLPEANEKFGELGMDSRMHYFASRSAPMGAVTANVVAATFYNFNPELVAAAIPAAWELASPAAVTRLRYEIIETALPRVLGEDLANSSAVARAADMLRRTADAIPNADGRPLYGAHAELAWPEPPYAQLWHAITLLREYRGDGHIAALVTHRLNGLEALVTHTAMGIGFKADFARLLRGWSDEQWAAAVEGLRARGLVDASGELTDEGTKLRSKIENLTDKLAYPPWRTLSNDQVSELIGLAELVREAVRAAGLIPTAGLGPRYGQHR
ncbi:MAG: hypothetical protein JWR37_3639 [Mycobacterium sp.]|nr:hypothetical protein [Mycobacterium sp.]